MITTKIDSDYDYKYKYNKKDHTDYLKQLGEIKDPDFIKEFNGLTQKEIKKYIRENIVDYNLVNKVKETLPKCTLSIKPKYNVWMNYCDAKIWNKKSKFQYIGCHATSIENSRKIMKEGFYPNGCLSTEEKFFQSIQVGERIGDKYIILLVLFKVKNVIYGEHKKYRPSPWDWDRYCENLKKAKIDLSYDGYCVTLLNPKHTTIFGYILCDNDKYYIRYL